jgi:hypothetical protein
MNPSPDSDQQFRTDKAFLDLLKKLSGKGLFAHDDAPLTHSHRSLLEDCVAVVRDPAKGLWLRTVGKKLARVGPQHFSKEEEACWRALTTGDSGLGQGTSLSEPLSTDVYNLLLRYGAFRTLGVVPMATGIK